MANEGETTKVEFEGGLDTATAQELNDDIKKILDNAGKRLELDCEKTTYIRVSGGASS